MNDETAAPERSPDRRSGRERRTPPCHAAMDGDCVWTECPQLRNRQPHCPLDATPEVERRLCARRSRKTRAPIRAVLHRLRSPDRRSDSVPVEVGAVSRTPIADALHEAYMKGHKDGANNQWPLDEDAFTEAGIALSRMYTRPPEPGASERVGYGVMVHGYDESKPPALGRERDRWHVDAFFYPFERARAEEAAKEYREDASPHVVSLYATPPAPSASPESVAWMDLAKDYEVEIKRMREALDAVRAEIDVDGTGKMLAYAIERGLNIIRCALSPEAPEQGDE